MTAIGFRLAVVNYENPDSPKISEDDRVHDLKDALEICEIMMNQHRDSGELGMDPHDEEIYLKPVFSRS